MKIYQLLVMLYCLIFLGFKMDSKPKSIILVSRQSSLVYPMDFSRTIIHYFKGDMTLYSFQMEIDTVVEVEDISMGEKPIVWEEKESMNNNNANLNNYPKIEQYYLRKNGSSHALTFNPFLNGKEKKVDFVEFDMTTRYESNLMLVNMVASLNKKLIKSVQPSRNKWIDTYVMADGDKNKIDSIIITYDNRFNNIPFSFSRQLDKVHESKVVSLLIKHQVKIDDNNIAVENFYEIKENPIDNPQKIDSIFAELIPYLPK
ncbi:hypothetical protein VB264_17445 [Arcicella aquatica]|uniref:Uncharacterized protein n=1 Tax=Arcicella aquatica TaxID=217141 RepID=A0ABU5QR62_9BACT|nr:hypothetical protein [Arcicella aquatica]MEA5259587.1 hypothetical protein [Arcicella aquatica]